MCHLVTTSRDASRRTPHAPALYSVLSLRLLCWSRLAPVAVRPGSAYRFLCARPKTGGALHRVEGRGR